MYDATDYLVNVRGDTGGSESWSNSWSFKGQGTPTEDAASIAEHLNGLYTAWTTFASWLAPNYTHVGATLKFLLSGDTIELPWDPAVGNGAATLLPTQLAMRISMTAEGGVHGGPFIAGFNETANDGSLIAISCVNDFAGALETMYVALLADGIVPGINRPTVDEVALVTHIRIGHRWDVIRKRGNDTAEGYTSVDFT